jgi:AraC-like DNA-binding protein
MESIFYVSAAFEAAIALACSIFIVLLLSTELLPKKVSRNGILLFLNLMFIALFYLAINVGWIHLAIPLIWLFIPSTITVGLFFYRFNTVWLNQPNKLDRLLTYIPLLVLAIAVVLEVLNYTSPENAHIHAFRIQFTENTMKYLFPLYSGTLIILNFVKLRRAELQNQETYASNDVVNLNWSRISLSFYVVFYIGIILSELVDSFVSELLFNISILILVLYLGYYQIRVIARYLKVVNTAPEAKEQESEAINETNSALDPKLEELFSSVNELVDSEGLYLDFDLSIHELGKRMNTNSKYLSQAINKKNGLNFNRFINEKRVAHASRLILDDEYSGYTLEGIAKESGFRSKSTFNTTFKAIIGCTPSEYKKRNSSQLLDN